MSRSMAARNVTTDHLLAARVETAAGLWAKFMGLMGRPSLAAGDALLLPHSNGVHMMFIRVSIDALFLGAAGGGRHPHPPARPPPPAGRPRPPPPPRRPQGG